MADYITLLGAEQVANAATRMERAADKIERATYDFTSSVDRLARLLETHTSELSGHLAEHVTNLESLADNHVASLTELAEKHSE